MASRRWIDLAMLTPGVSQDNIRGFFYRGNVNIGAGTREYSNGFVVDGVNNTWAQMGEPRQNFAMDSIREFKVSQSTYKAEYGLATGGLLTRRDQVGHQRASRLGSPVLPRQVADRARRLRAERPDFRRYQYGGTFGGPIVRNRTHFFVAVERTDENQFFTVNTGGVFPQYDGTYLERPVSLDLHGQGRSPDHANQMPLRPRSRRRSSTGRSSPPAAACIRPTASTSPCRAIRTSSATPGSSSPRMINDFRVAVRLREVRGGAALQPRLVGAGRLRRRPPRLLHGGLQLPVARGSAAAATARWARRSAGSSATTSSLDDGAGAARTS